MLRMWRPAVLVAICLAVLIGSPAVAAERIRIGWQPSLTYGMYVMMGETFAEKEGLTVEYLKFNSGPAMLAALASGDIDMASFTVVPGVYALAQGIDIKFILLTEDFQTGEALVARRQSGIRTMRDQRGKRIAVTKGSIAHWGLLRSLKASNLTEKDLTVLDMAPGVMVPAFIKGDIDGAWVWEPWVVKLEQEGGVTAGSFRELGMPALNTIVVRSGFLGDNGATVQKFLRVWDRALSVPVNEKTVATISSTLGMTPEMTRAALAKLKPFAMEEQLRGRLGSMGTTETKAESSLLSHLKEFVSFLVEEKKLKSSIADNALLRSVEPGPVQEYLKLKR
jgi:taurine ABC transporter substrate-binding protein